MTISRTPWSIGGGAILDQDTMRELAFAATGKREGIISAGDLKVRAYPTPGKGVLIGDGGALILNKSTGGTGQSYLVPNDGDADLQNMPDPGGVARSDLVVARVVDPQYAPWSATDVGRGEFALITNVPSTTTKVSDLNGGGGLPYSAYAVCRIDRPAGSTSVTNTMIVDLRKLANPRSERSLNAYSLVAANAQVQNSTTGEQWPSAITWNVDVPDWAGRVAVVATWSGVNVPPGDARGTLWAYLGLPDGSVTLETQHVVYNSPNSTNYQRSTLRVSGTLTVPAGLRGKTVRAMLKAQLTSGLSAARLILDGASSVDLDLQFTETAI